MLIADDALRASLNGHWNRPRTASRRNSPPSLTRHISVTYRKRLGCARDMSQQIELNIGKRF
ncbi:hypothetical protein KCP71_02705 [Salmonella enterica subsp. enterica]|nr:hypothetical protein KCP71_02705 [Salmonella enterica subsp. enterica]